MRIFMKKKKIEELIKKFMELIEEIRKIRKTDTDKPEDKNKIKIIKITSPPGMTSLIQFENDMFEIYNSTRDEYYIKKLIRVLSQVLKLFSIIFEAFKIFKAIKDICDIYYKPSNIPPEYTNFNTDFSAIKITGLNENFKNLWYVIILIDLMMTKDFTDGTNLYSKK